MKFKLTYSSNNEEGEIELSTLEDLVSWVASHPCKAVIVFIAYPLDDEGIVRLEVYDEARE